MDLRGDSPSMAALTTSLVSHDVSAMVGSLQVRAQSQGKSVRVRMPVDWVQRRKAAVTAQPCRACRAAWRPNGSVAAAIGWKGQLPPNFNVQSITQRRTETGGGHFATIGRVVSRRCSPVGSSQP